MTLSGLCMLHCLGGFLLFSAFAVAGDIFFDPIFHEVGLALAVVLGAYALGRGYRRHRRLVPLIVGVTGIALMAGALAVMHGHYAEMGMTVVGVGLVAVSHYLNRQL